MTAVVALGDSFTCGEGVGVRVDPDATWTALLAAALPDGRLLRLAEPGAGVADVRLRQLPGLPERADVATLLVGLNDVARAGFDPATVARSLLDLVAELRTRADEVLVGRLHDAVALLPLPARVAGTCRARIEAVNAAVDRAGEWPRVRVLDLARVPALAEPGAWAVDRIHPSAAGHRAMAVAAVRVLAGPGGSAGPVEDVVVPRGPSRRQRAGWAVRHGLPYAAGHLRELGGPLVSAALRRG